MPNVYVGQLADIRHGAVYANITEAVKEVCRAQKPGMVICFIYLPDSPEGKYWIVGAIGPAANTKWNLIYTNSSDAEKHAESLIARGFPKSEVICKELKVHTKGPDVIDIKTEEHFICERELNLLKAAIEKGVVADNSSSVMKLTIDEGDLYVEKKFAIIDTSVHALSFFENPQEVLDNLAVQRKLLLEVSLVDPDEQPIKWERLRREAAHLAQANASPDEGKPSEPSEPTT